MERVSTLLKKLQQQFDEKAPAITMLSTVHLIQVELESLVKKAPSVENSKVSILMPFTYGQNIHPSFTTCNNVIADKEVSTLELNQNEVEEELAEIKQNSEKLKELEQSEKEAYQFYPIEEVPTLSHQDSPTRGTVQEQLRFDYQESLNDRLKEDKTELSQSLTSAPIKDLKKAIGVNDRFLFLNELFRGDEAMYERSIKTIQNFSIYAEAEFWIRRELKAKIGWIDSDPVVKQFDGLIKRRFA
jgi:hypothetical protein